MAPGTGEETGGGGPASRGLRTPGGAALGAAEAATGPSSPRRAGPGRAAGPGGGGAGGRSSRPGVGRGRRIVLRRPPALDLRGRSPAPRGQPGPTRFPGRTAAWGGPGAGLCPGLGVGGVPGPPPRLQGGGSTR